MKPKCVFRKPQPRQILDQSSAATLTCDPVIEVSCAIGSAVATTEALESAEKESSEPSMSIIPSEAEDGVEARNSSNKSDKGVGGEPCKTQSNTEKQGSGCCVEFFYLCL